jgi:hypothetical protein
MAIRADRYHQPDTGDQHHEHREATGNPNRVTNGHAVPTPDQMGAAQAMKPAASPSLASILRNPAAVLGAPRSVMKT